MAKKVRFHSKVSDNKGKTKTLNDAQKVKLNNLPVPNPPTESQDTKQDSNDVVEQASTMVTVVGVIGAILFIAALCVWIAGLVRMGKCNGTHTGFFWATLLLFILLPGPGTVAAFIMAIMALVMLKPGSEALGMTCPK